MPVLPENIKRYPSDWLKIAAAVKEAAGWHCECNGECGKDHRGRCPDTHGMPAHDTRKTVVMTCAHLDHQPENVDRANLKCFCAPCHLRYDAGHHAETRAATRAAGLAAQMEPLFEIGAA
jgi:hypothetical protein